MNIQTIQKNLLSRVASFFMVVGMIFSSIPLPAYAALYSPGETLNPTCLPTDANCDVLTFALKGRLSEALTGTVSITPGLSTVTGSSTAFTTELSAGDAIKIGSGVFTVGSISSNTSLTLGSAVATSTATTTGATAYRDPTNLFSVAKGDSTNVLTVSKAGLLSLINTLAVTGTGTSTFSGGLSAANLATAGYGQLGRLVVTGTATSTVSDGLSVGGNLSLGSLSGFLKATSGLVTATSTLDIGSNTFGTLAVSRGGTGLSTVTQNSLLVGGAGNTWLQVATSSLGLLTTNVAEGTNQYFTNTRARSALSVSGGGSALSFSTTTGAFTLATSSLGVALSDTTGILAIARGGTGTSTAPTYGGLLMGNASGTYDLVATSSLGFAPALTGTGGQTITFDTTGAQTATSTLYISSAGNIGIGTTSPGSKLAVAGGFSVSTQTQTGTQTNPTLISTGATSVDTTTVAGQTIITYASTTATKQFKAPTGVSNVRVVVVGGGGGGGGATGGGGGAGGMKDIASLAVSDATSYTITVGAGGAGGLNSAADKSGETGIGSSFGTVATTTGGGGGGSVGATTGKSGGSGGGGAGSVGAAGGTGITGEGNDGGASGVWTSPYRGGGGGGVGSVGSTTLSTVLGHGGLGSSSNITGSSSPIFYAGGGGGGTFGESGSNFGIGGSGVGGNGSIAGNGVAGTANKGGGGGGAGNNTGNGGAGGSGVVIVRFATVAATATSSQALFKVTNAGTDTNSVLAFFETGASQSCIIAGQTGLSCSSDENLKKDIEATESVLGSVLALKPVTYNWRTAEEIGAEGFDPYATAGGVTGEQVGFIAQDVEQLFPGLVRIDPNGNRTLAYDKFAPLIVAALQEQYGGMMGVNIASVIAHGGSVDDLFASTSTLATLNGEQYEYSSIISNPIGYVTERVDAGIKVARALVAEKMIAVEASFKRIFANELCLTDASGQLVCVTGENLKQIGGNTHTVAQPVTTSPESSQQTADVVATTDVVQEGPTLYTDSQGQTLDAGVAVETVTEITPSEPVVEAVPEPLPVEESTPTPAESSQPTQEPAPVTTEAVVEP